MSKWIKYSYVCTDCDALMEITTKIPPTKDPTCNCTHLAWVIQTAIEPVKGR